MTTPTRIAAAISALVLGGTLAISTAGQAEPGQTRGQDIADCTGRQLDVTLGRLDAAAGSRYQKIRFTNVSERRCLFHGHPKVSFRGKHHRRIGWPAESTGSGDAFVLRPGRTAKTALQIPYWRNFPVADCRAKGSPRLRVVPPGTQRKVGFHYPAKTCTTKQGRSYVRPVHLAR